LGSSTGIAPGAPGRTAPQSPQSFQRPSQSQVSNFLNLPQQPQAGARNGGPPVASQLPSGGPGSQSKTVTTPGGSTITIAGGKGSGTTPGGATVGGAGAGVKIEGAGGNTYVKGKGVAGATDGTTSAVRAGGFTGARDTAGNAAVNIRGGYADSSGQRQGGSLTAARNQWGYTGVNVRGGYGAGGVGQVGSITAIRGPGGSVVATGRGAAFVNGQFVGGRTWTAVNGAYTRWGYFTPGWYGRYPGAWWPGKWAIATTAWATVAWATAGRYCGCSGDGTYYDYGGNVTYDNGTVYYGDQPVATAEQYYDQAGQIAASGRQEHNEEWLPLGVFAVIAEPAQTQTDKVVQLALNKEGVIRGNLQDSLAGKVTPVVGAVDENTQRVAMKLEGNDSVVVETGLYNLTNDEVPLLVHFGPDQQESRTLIRLKQPEGQEPHP
jgi:hypothetical protein